MDTTNIDKQNQYSDLPKLPSGYRYIKKISSGGQGKVLLVENQNMDRREAIKILLGMQVKHSNAYQRFCREIKILAQLDHPNIIRIHYANIQECYFTMEYLKEGTLKDVMDRKMISLREGVEIIKQIAEGLQYAHKQGLIHRDLKPQNILFTKNQVPKITDFGIVKVTEGEAKNHTKFIIGSPHYMSPEQWNASEKIDLRTDIWSLGVILYQMLTEQLPFSGSQTEIMAAVFTKPLTAPREIHPQGLNSKVFTGAESICLRALQKDKENRYSSVDEMIEDLDKIIYPLAKRKKTEHEAPEALDNRIFGLKQILIWGPISLIAFLISFYFESGLFSIIGLACSMPVANGIFLFTSGYHLSQIAEKWDSHPDSQHWGYVILGVLGVLIYILYQITTP